MKAPLSPRVKKILSDSESAGRLMREVIIGERNSNSGVFREVEFKKGKSIKIKKLGVRLKSNK